jgi:hypothetical protein
MQSVGINIITGETKNLTVSRKLGWKSLINNSDQWVISTQSKDCWIKDNHKFTILLWSQRIGVLNKLPEDEITFYRN